MRNTTPVKPSRISLMCRWKCSGALDIQNGIFVEAEKPKEVMHECDQ